ncbi:hypothetical protein ACPCUK_33600 [Streptomyces arboris]|uniref:hypothetical protein n=1 Tax=Streptomyces arboris TaxID=2600619 RepID=UPI003C307187
MMPVEGFEALARICPETVTLGLINGELEVQPVPDGDHGEIIMWVAMQCVQQQPELRLYGQRGLRIGGDRNGRAEPWPERAASPVTAHGRARTSSS